MVNLQADGVQVTHEPSIQGYEISVLLSTEDAEGSYTFVVTEMDWQKAVEHGGIVDIDSPLPELVAAKKK